MLLPSPPISVELQSVEETVAIVHGIQRLFEAAKDIFEFYTFASFPIEKTQLPCIVAEEGVQLPTYSAQRMCIDI